MKFLVSRYNPDRDSDPYMQEFEVEVPRIDESTLRDSLLAEETPHRDIADALAEMKALRVSEKRPGRLVLGSDQVLSCDGALYSKPEDRAEARAHLATLRGRKHVLVTAAVIAEDGRLFIAALFGRLRRRVDRPGTVDGDGLGGDAVRMVGSTSPVRAQ